LHTTLQSEKVKEDYFGDLGIDGRIISKFLLKKNGVRMWAVPKWLE
jgi:hypothetical protein